MEDAKQFDEDIVLSGERYTKSHIIEAGATVRGPLLRLFVAALRPLQQYSRASASVPHSNLALKTRCWHNITIIPKAGHVEK